MRHFLVIALATIGLVACDNSSVLTEPVTANANVSQPQNNCGVASGIVADEKALYAVELSYNVPAHSYVTLNKAGKLDDGTKAEVKPMLTQLYGVVKGAREAYKLGDVCTFQAYYDAAKALGKATEVILEERKL